MNLFLIGMMGSGKSTVGRLLAKALGWQFQDSDTCIEKSAGKTISQIFKEKGEPFFRELEEKTLKELSAGDRCVIATGGGAPLREANWESFKKGGLTVWLKARPQQLLERLERGADKRPLLAGGLTLERVSELDRLRAPYYAKADHTLETDGMQADQAAKMIEAWIKTKERK